jgi:hypothetical protein
LDNINELELRKLLKEQPNKKKLANHLIKCLLDKDKSWEEQRSYWHFLYFSGREMTLAYAMIESLKAKLRLPFDLYIQLCGQQRIKPKQEVVLALIKGARKQKALGDFFSVTAFDRYDKRFGLIRSRLLERKISEQKKFKQGLVEKFEFLQNQRMTEQAGRVLRRMVELYPEEKEFHELKRKFDEQWARDVLANHAAAMSGEKLDRTPTPPSRADEEMLNCFAREGEKLCVERRELAADLAIDFLFMEDFPRALEILAWAPSTMAGDWLKAELLFHARRYIEALEQLNLLEVKYIGDPETTFAASYLRAQCLYASGQRAGALEILQSIVRVRPAYRSAHALFLEWTEGAAWD